MQNWMLLLLQRLLSVGKQWVLTTFHMCSYFLKEYLFQPLSLVSSEAFSRLFLFQAVTRENVAAHIATRGHSAVLLDLLS